MKIILENNIKKLISEDGFSLLDKEDLEKPKEERYYFKFAYLPQSRTLEDCEASYIEINDSEIGV